jgi:hypothetical protein
VKKSEIANMFRNTAIATLLAAVQCVVALHALADAPDAQGSAETAWRTRSWAVSRPEEQGMDSGGLARLIDIVGTCRQDSLRTIGAGLFLSLTSR